MHREAARRTLLQLGNDDTAFNAALRDLLLHRDGNLADCEALLANMLSLRDQWGNLVPLTQPELDDATLDATVLPRLTRALDHAICSQLTRLDALFPPDALADLSALAAKLGEFDGYRGSPSPISICAGRSQPPESVAAHLEHWQALIHILLTPSGKAWRRGFNVNHVGFEHDKHHKLQMKAIVDQLSLRDDLLDALCSVRALPPARYPADQWAVAKSLFRVLSRALVELQLVFAERNQCDFTELSLLARHALSEDSGPEDLAAALGARLQHLLVDEMQDTSTSQYDLLEMLTRSWDGHSQTVFLVGDPRQSIYLFRQARVERFIRATHTERLGALPLTRLQLTANFRSQSGLVDRFNEDFALIFPRPDNPAANPHALPYSPAESTLPASPIARGVVWHAHPQPYVPPVRSSFATSGTFLTAAQLQSHQAKLDAREIRRIAQEWFVKQLPPGRTKPWTIAVLVRSRNHLNEIVAEFEKDALGRIPYRAVEITPLSERQEVLDLTAITRALLHPADRAAALAILRAPWCGLSLAACTPSPEPMTPLSSAAPSSASSPTAPISSPPTPRQRVARVEAVLQSAAIQRARLTTAQLVERAWRSLGGDVWLSAAELTNARRYFELLDSLEAPGIGIDLAVLAERLQKLYAEPNPIPDSTPCVELLTIHNAKGLEWDVVFVPALERMSAQDKSRLLRWSEIDSPGAPQDDAAHIMLAPISSRGQDPHPLYKWLGRVLYAREVAERQRLLYVACTRSRQELHLFASPATKADGAIGPHHLSLLKSAWPASERHFHQPAADIARKPAAPVDSPALALAAAADWQRPKVLRLPLAFDPAARFAEARARKLPSGDAGIATVPTLFARPEGSFSARSFGNAVHACLQILANRILDLGATPAALLAELPAWTPRIAAILRNDGLPQATVTHLTRDTLAALENTLRDPIGLWLLTAHPGGDAELAVTALTTALEPSRAAARAESVRIDRIFHAGPNLALPAKTISGSSTTRPLPTAPPASTTSSPTSAPPTARNSKPMPASSPRCALSHPNKSDSRSTSPLSRASSGGLQRAPRPTAPSSNLKPQKLTHPIAVPHILAPHPEDHVFGNIRRVISHPLQVARDDQRVQALRRQLRLVFDQRAQRIERPIVHLIHLIVQRQHRLRQFRVPLDKRLQRLAHHRRRHRRQLGNVHRKFNVRERAHLPHPHRDVHCLVTHPLQVGIDPDHRQDKAQVDRHRLFHGQQIERHLINLALQPVDRRLRLKHKFADRLIACAVCLDRALNRLLRHTRHNQQALLQVVEVLLEFDARCHRNHFS